MIFTDTVIKAVEEANLLMNHEDFDEYAYWKSTIRKDMKLMIAGKQRIQQLDILIKWYATTFEYKRLLPVAKIIDEYHLKTVRDRFLLCDNFWKHHEEDESEWMWQSAVHDDTVAVSIKNVADMLKYTRNSLCPIHNDIGALLTAEMEGL